MNVSARLRAIMRDGNLTIADLARWFERPHPTVRGWVHGGDVGGAQLDREAINVQLGKLEVMLKKQKGLPIPRLSPSKRIEYLEELR
jgi:hypothetical protein